MSDLQNLYQELILDHSRTPHGYGLREGDPGSLSPPAEPDLR